MMRKILSINLIFLLLAGYSVAQTHVPAARDSKRSMVGSATIGKGSGVMNYSIPLFSIEAKGHKLPIRLVYVGDGIKPGVPANWVGEGWQLVVGGQISRVMNDLPDDGWEEISPSDNSTGMYGYMLTDQPPHIVTDILSQGLIDIWEAWPFINVAFENDNLYKFSLMAFNILDSEPDYFNYTIYGLESGKFTPLQPGEDTLIASMQNFQPNILDLTGQLRDIRLNTNTLKRIIGFSLKNQTGLNYVFHEPEFTTFEEIGNSGQQDYALTWYLTQIKNEIGEDLFEFHYTESSEPIERHSFMSYKVRSDKHQMNSTNHSVSVVNIHKKYISRVDYSRGYILFKQFATDREDLTGNRALQYIEHYNTHGELIDKYELVYEYRGYDSDVSQTLRIFLVGLKYFPNGNSDISDDIAFDYQSGGIAMLPYKNSIAIDYWGYSNLGVDNNLPLNPNLASKPIVRVGDSYYPKDVNSFKTPRDVGRKINRWSTEVGVLKEIIYEHGKKLEFEYELNDYSYIETELNEVSGQFQVYDNLEAGIQSTNGNQVWTSIPFTLPYSQWVKITYLQNNGCLNTAKIWAYDQFFDLPDNEDVWLYLEGDVQYMVRPHGDSTGRCPVMVPGFAPDDPNDNPDDPSVPAPAIILQYKKHVVDEADSYRKKAGGLRIAKIITSDNNGRHYARIFNYSDFNNPLLSSGLIVSEPNTIYNSGYYVEGETVNYSYTCSSTSGVAGFLMSNPIIYKNIEEYTCELNNNGDCLNDSNSKDVIGSIRKTFTYNPPEENALAYPFMPNIKNFSRKILLDNVKYLNTDGEIIKETKYEYEYEVDNTISTQGSKLVRNRYEHRSQNDNNVVLKSYLHLQYSVQPEFTRIKKVTTKTYNILENEINSVSSENFYDEEYHNTVIKSIKKLSDGSEKMVKKSYSGTIDFQGASPTGIHAIAIKNMQNQGRLNVPIEEQTYITVPFYADPSIEVQKLISHKYYLYRTLASGKVVLYKIVNRRINNDFIYATISLAAITPSGTYEYTYNPLLDEVAEIHKYNTDYIPLEKEDATGTFSTLLLDNKKRPIAKISNGRLATSRYTSFEAPDYNGGWYYDQTNVVAATPTDKAITGDYYYNLGTANGNDGDFNSATGGVNPALPSGEYLLTYWAKGDVSVSYSTGAVETGHSSLVENGWTYNERIVAWNQGEDNFITLSGTGYIDELRLHEINATMETMGYYTDGKVKYKCSPTGGVLTYEYDLKNRLEWVLDRERNVIEHHKYAEKDIADVNSYNKHTVITAKVEGLSKADFANADYDEVTKQVAFADGLGRFRQSIDYRVTTNDKDKIAFAEYDPFGRTLKKHLPYFAFLPGDDAYIQDALTQQENYYLNQDDPNEVNTAPYMVTVPESSPLQRPVEVGGAGEALQPGNGHSTHIAYGWNTVEEQIRKWEYYATSESASAPTVYPANALRKKTVTGPDGRVHSTFTDARGRTVATTVEAEVRYNAAGRAYTGTAAGTSTASTEKITSYVVYDHFGRVVFEIPAKAMEELALIGANGDYSIYHVDIPSNATETVIDELITSYSYDNKGRILQKDMPGNGRQKFVYDHYNRVIMSRDEQEIADGKWNFVKYDTRGRAILKGVGLIANGRAYHSDASANHYDADGEIIKGEEFIGSSGSLMGYTNTTYPDMVTENQLTNAYYFDNYDFDYPPEFAFIPFNEIAAPLDLTRGLPTGSKTRILNADGTLGAWLTTISWYDDKKRPVQVFTQNHRGGWDRIDTYYNEYGQVEMTMQYHRFEAASDEHVFKTRFTYFDSGQLFKTYCKIDTDPEIMVSLRRYNEKGQLKDLKLHRPGNIGNSMQSIDYRYNAQGKLTHINNTALIIDAFNTEDYDVFGQELTYFDESPEYYVPSGVPSTTDPFEVIPQYGGNISSMMWNAKTPEEDGTMLSRHAYIYRYDDLGNMTKALYSSDSPSSPGEFDVNKNYYNEVVSYDLGGNIIRLKRNRTATPATFPSATTMDDITYTYRNHGYAPIKIDDAGERDYTPQFKHFVDIDKPDEYTYDLSGRMTRDKNKNILMEYNLLGLPRLVYQPDNPAYSIEYTYDAAGNKLQKKFKRDVPTPPAHTEIIKKDYIGNFVYENGELKMIYHPEGVIRPTPATASNTTEYVYDYFIKDYLGNVRVVLTEEDATYTQKFLATMEEVYRQIEEDNFDHISETAQPLPPGYPVDGSAAFNEQIAKLSEATGTEIGPSIVLPVKRGDKVSLSSRYFYKEVGQNVTYDNVNLLVNEILMSLATSGAGVLRLNEAGLIDIAAGNGQYGAAILNLLSNSFDTSDVSKPHSYMIWMLYDNNMKLIPEGSGAKRVTDPNQLGTLIEQDIPALTDGYLHCFVSNTGLEPISYDNFMVTYLRGKTRQINHYYPYGLSISSLSYSDEYLNKYTSKELQTGEFGGLALSSGLEMFDFGSRFYDPALGRWFTPDPAEQFANPYLAMGNNPVMYVDPDGEFVWFVPLIFAAVNVGVDLAINEGNMNFGQIAMSAGIGALGGILGGGSITTVGQAFLSAGVSQVNRFLPSVPLYQSDNFSLSLSPMVGFGSSGFNFGGSVNASGQSGDFVWSASMSAGHNSGMSSLGDAAGGSNYFGVGGFAGYNDGHANYGLGLSSTKFTGNTNQRVGAITAQIGDFSIRLDEDYIPGLGDREDRYRTGGLLMTYKVNNDLTLALGGSMITGDADPNQTLPGGNPNVKNGFYDSCGERCYDLRGGTMYGGAIYKGQAFFAGHNSEKRLHDVQNWIHRNVTITSPYFEDRMLGSGSYSYYGGYNPYYLYY